MTRGPEHAWHYVAAKGILYRCCDCGAVESFDPAGPEGERYWLAEHVSDSVDAVGERGCCPLPSDDEPEDHAERAAGERGEGE